MRRAGLAIAAVAAIATPMLSAGPASAAPDRSLTVAASDAVLTLPAGDGLRDSTLVRVLSPSSGRVDLLAVRGRTTLPLREEVVLVHTAAGWARTVRVPVKGLTAGPWVLRARRTDAPAVVASTRIRVGSGEPVHAAVVPLVRTVYPYRDHLLDAVDARVVATDETGSDVPVSGTVRLTSAGEPRTATIAGGQVRIRVTGLPLGSGTLLGTLTGPAGDPVRRRVAVVLAPTAVGTARVTASADTVQPVEDGLLDDVVLTTSARTSAGAARGVSGTLAITAPDGLTAQRWTVPDGEARTFTWDGRVLGKVVPGTYTATLTLKGPEGLPTTRTTTITVSSAHLPYRVRKLFPVAAGNQQGLAVHDGVFYVGYDNGDGTARIERYSSSGAQQPALGPLAIGHAAELSFSTTTGSLYAANGGSGNPTTVWALDPGTGAVRQTFDLSRLGPNGMVAVDDAGGRLLVFAGTTGAYTVSAVSLVDVTDPATGAVTQPAGSVLATVPIAIKGVPQGIEASNGELWMHTSMKGRNRIVRYDLSGNAWLQATTADAVSDLMTDGEGEGLAISTSDAGLQAGLYVNIHGPNRIGYLEPVSDE